MQNLTGILQRFASWKHSIALYFSRLCLVSKWPWKLRHKLIICPNIKAGVRFCQNQGVFSSLTEYQVTISSYCHEVFVEISFRTHSRILTNAVWLLSLEDSANLESVLSIWISNSVYDNQYWLLVFSCVDCVLFWCRMYCCVLCTLQCMYYVLSLGVLSCTMWHHMAGFCRGRVPFISATPMQIQQETPETPVPSTASNPSDRGTTHPLWHQKGDI